MPRLTRGVAIRTMSPIGFRYAGLGDPRLCAAKGDSFMKASARTVICVAIVLTLPAPYAAVAHADEAAHPAWKEGRLRLELAGFAGTNTTSEPRSGDVSIMGSIEYEGPLTKWLTLGAKFIPVFYYNPDIPDAPDIHGAALGPELRYYSKPGKYRGIFGEAGGAVLATSKKFDKNTATVNFVIEFGAGYAFKNGWHVALKFRHISNAFLSFENSGADAVGLGLGYRF